MRDVALLLKEMEKAWNDAEVGVRSAFIAELFTEIQERKLLTDRDISLELANEIAASNFNMIPSDISTLVICGFDSRSKIFTQSAFRRNIQLMQ